MTTNRRGATLALGAVLAIGLAGYTGWALNSMSRPSHEVTIEETFTGTLSVVSGDLHAGCVRPDSGGRQRCGVLFTDRGQPRPAVGQHVRAARELVRARHDQGYELLVIYPATED